MAGQTFTITRAHSSSKLKGCAFAALSCLSCLSHRSDCLAWSPTTAGSVLSGSRLSNLRIKDSIGSQGVISARSRSTTTRRMSTPSTCLSTSFAVAQFPCLNDNYGYLIHDAATGQTAAIDTPCARTYQQELQKRGWKLTHVFNTHHHWDHTGGNMELKTDDVVIYGPENEKAKIPGIDVALAAGDPVSFGKTTGIVMDVGGHTKGHIAYYFPAEETVFVGDSLFALGCGRMFEGTPTQFWSSLKALRELPDETVVYCAHEYTEGNAKFAVSVEPGNEDLLVRAAEVTAKRALGEPTVPSKMGYEKKTNPFLRVDLSEEIRRNVGVVAGDSDADAFGKVRHAKDTFRG